MGANASYFGEAASTSCAYPWANATMSLLFTWHPDSISSVRSAVRLHWMTQTLKSWPCPRASCLTTTRSLRNAVFQSAATHGDAARIHRIHPLKSPPSTSMVHPIHPQRGERKRQKHQRRNNRRQRGNPTSPTWACRRRLTRTSSLMRRIGNQPTTWHSC